MATLKTIKLTYLPDSGPVIGDRTKVCGELSLKTDTGFLTLKPGDTIELDEAVWKQVQKLPSIETRLADRSLIAA